MGLRLSTTPPTVSEQEEQAELALGRKATAEGEFLILSQDKKKLQEDIAELQEDIEIKKKQIEDYDEQIPKILNDIKEVKYSFEVENDILDKTKSFRQDAEKELADYKNSVELKKKGLLDNFSNTEKDCNEKITKKLEELKSLEDKKITVIHETNEQIEIADEILARQNDEVEKISALQKNVSDLQVKESAFIESIAILQVDMAELDREKEEKKLELVKLSNDIRSKNDDILKLNDEIISKKEEKRGLEQYVFGIANRQSVLEQKEAFIKSQYERAGIKWDEN